MQRYDKPGNLDGAIAEYQAAVKTDPAFALGWAGLGEAYLAKFHVEQIPKWLDEAIASCTRAAQIDSSLAPVHVALGRTQMDTGKLDLAVQEFQRALDLNPRNSDALSGLAGVYERQGRFAEAEKTYQRAIALRSDYWEGYNRLADFYLRQKRPAEAEAQLKHVIEITPDNWVGYVNMGVALISQNKYDESAQAFEKSIQLAPSYVAYVNLANVYYRQLKPAQAAPLLEKALALNDADYRAWFNYALANRWLEIKGDKAAGEKARSAYQRALKILEDRSTREPNNEDMRIRLAMIYGFFGRRADALREIESLRALNPNPADFDPVRAQVLDALGERQQAIAALESALRAGFKHEVAQRNPELQRILSDPNFKPQH
jgi:serine/threonine-protein kinase